MAGLPLESWILIAASVGLGLALELAYLWARRGDRASRAGRSRGTDVAVGSRGEPDRPPRPEARP